MPISQAARPMGADDSPCELYDDAGMDDRFLPLGFVKEKDKNV